MSLSQTSVLKLYNSVIEDVISGVREAFLDEGVDDQVLQELKSLWEMKLMSNKAVEANPEPLEPTPPQIGQKSNSKSGGAKKNQAAAAAAAPKAAAAVAPTAAENAADVKVPIPTPVPVAGPSASNGGNLVQGSNAMSTTQGGLPVVTQSGVNQTMTPALQQTHLNQLNRLPQQQPVSQPLQNQAPIMKSQTVLQTLPQQTQPPQQPPQQAPQQTPSPFNLLSTDPNRQVPIQITLPAQPNIPDAQARVLTIHVPASALTGNQLQQVLTGPVISATMNLPLNLAQSLLQQHVNAALQGQAANAAAVQLQSASSNQNNGVAPFGHQTQAANTISQLDGALISQLDGALDTSDEDEDDDDDDDDIDDDDENDERDEDENDENEGGAEEEPLNSGDDVSDEDPQDLFDTENVVVCQYDKITRTRNKWKFYLKDGIMNLNGKDFVFQRANGDAEW